MGLLGAQVDELFDNLNDEVGLSKIVFRLCCVLVLLYSLVHQRAGSVDHEQGISDIQLSAFWG